MPLSYWLLVGHGGFATKVKRTLTLTLYDWLLVGNGGLKFRAKFKV